jgi:hypothetical protein
VDEMMGDGRRVLRGSELCSVTGCPHAYMHTDSDSFLLAVFSLLDGTDKARELICRASGILVESRQHHGLMDVLVLYDKEPAV